MLAGGHEVEKALTGDRDRSKSSTRLQRCPMNGKRILYVDNRVSYVVSHRLPLLQAARDRGFDVHVTTLTEGDASELEAAGVTYHEISSGGRSNNPFDEVGLIYKLSRLYRRLDPDLVHHVTLRSILYGGIAARLVSRPPVVDSVTGLGYLFSGSSWKVRLARKSVLLALRGIMRHPQHRVIFQNPDDARLFERAGIVPEERAVLIKGSGVSLDVFPLKSFPNGQEAPAVLMASRLLWHKGVGEFVEAARCLRAKGVEARFLLAGEYDPDNPASIPRRVLERWHEEGVIEWLGYCDDMSGLLARVSLVCLPSYYREGVPKVLIEAAATGRPIVATRMPGCKEIVEDGVTGLLVPPQDGNALAEAIGRLMQDPQRSEEMGRRGRERVRAAFSLEHVVNRTLQTYQAVLRT